MTKVYLVSVISVICSFSHFGNAIKDEVYPQQNLTTKYGDGVSLERTTTFRNDYGIYFERATTYKIDYDVSPKIITKYTNGSGVSSDLTTHNMYDYSLSSAPMLETSKCKAKSLKIFHFIRHLNLSLRLFLRCCYATNCSFSYRCCCFVNAPVWF